MKKILLFIVALLGVTVYGQADFPEGIYSGAGVVVDGQVKSNASEPIAPEDLTRKDYVDTKSGGGKIYTVQAATVDNVRNDFPSQVVLDNGDILWAFSHFGADGSDIDGYYVAGKVSSDGGRTWGSVFMLQDIIPGTDNIGAVSLHKRNDGKILMLAFAQTAPVPTPESRIYKIVFNQDFTVFTAPVNITPAVGYWNPAADRIFKNPANGDLLYPVSNVLSGPGTSFESTYYSTIWKSTDEGATWVDLNLTIGQNRKVFNNTVGGGTEPGIYYTPEGLICYFRTLTGDTWAVRLNSSYTPVGDEFILFSSANACASVKWISSINMAVAGRTRLINGSPYGDNNRKFLDLLASTNGRNFSPVNEIDHASEATDWYVNEPMVFEYNNTVLIGYSNSKTGPKTASLFNKIYPKSFFNSYVYKPEPQINLTDSGKGSLINGVNNLLNVEGTLNVAMTSYPKGGTYSITGSSVTGAFKISLPNNKDSHITIKGFIYHDTNNSSLSFEITCNASNMAKNTVRINGYRIASNINVRFVDGTTPKILIGDLSSTWLYTSLIITEVAASYDTRLSDIAEGWKVEIESSSYGTVVSTKNPISETTIDGGTLKLYNGAGGSQLKLERNGNGVSFVQNSDGSAMFIMNKAESDAFISFFDGSMNTTFGGFSDAGYKLDVQGTGRFTGQLTVPTPSTGSSATPKTYVDTADALKANIAAPTFTGDAKAVTPTAGDNDTSIATTAFVGTALSNNYINTVDAIVTPTLTNSTTLTSPGAWGIGGYYNGNLVIYANATGGPIVVTLPSAASMGGRTLNVIKIDGSANSVTISGGATNINGATTYLLTTQYQNVTVKSNSTQFYIF